MQFLPCLYVAMVVVAAFLLWQLVRPRSLWWKLQAWRYKHPEANEPSDTAYEVRQVVALISLLALIGFGWFITTMLSTTPQEREYSNCLEERRGALNPEFECRDVSPSPEQS